MSDASVSAERFVHESRAVLDRVTGSASVREDVARAAELIAGCVRGDGVVQAFGTGYDADFDAWLTECAAGACAA
ncbi:hypothetical protein [Streptomyces nigra]